MLYFVVKSHQKVGDDLFCFGFLVMMCFVLDFGLLKPASTQFFGTKQPNFFGGQFKLSNLVANLWLVKKKMSNFPKSPEKKLRKKKLWFFTFVPPQMCCRGKKTEFWNPTDLMVWFKTTVYIYILPESNSKSPWKFQWLEDDEVSFWVKRPIFRRSVLLVSGRVYIHQNTHQSRWGFGKLPSEKNRLLWTPLEAPGKVVLESWTCWGNHLSLYADF